ncbi:MAG: hypothetical protein V1789_01540 [PVC group bacterium]
MIAWILSRVEKYNYKCPDKLHIPGTSPRKRSNDVFINGHKISKPDRSSGARPSPSGS